MKNKKIDKLLTKISLGDNEAFEELYLLTSRGVFAFLYSYLNNYQDTEDAMQSVYLKIKLHISTYNIGTNGKAWIFQIAKNYALNVISKRKKNATESIDDVKIAVEQNFDVDTPIMDLIKNYLSKEEQQILILHILWSYKHREIAEILNCPTGTITSKYKRAVEKLKIKIKEKKL